MFFNLFFFLLYLNFSTSTGHCNDFNPQADFVYNGFIHHANLNLDGIAQFTHKGLLQLTNSSTLKMSHAFYGCRLPLKNSSTGTTFSFSTTFVFAIVPVDPSSTGDGMAFVISRTNDFSGAEVGLSLGLFNWSNNGFFSSTNNGTTSNHIVAVEFDTYRNIEVGDIDGNHVGIDINGLNSSNSSTAAYYQNDNKLKNISLTSGDPVQVWVDYDGSIKQFNVTISPMGTPKGNIPLLSSKIDLPHIISDHMYVGFSSATGNSVSNHYVTGWSFKMNGPAPPLNVSRLPKPPKRGHKEKSKVLTTELPLIVTFLGPLAVIGVVFLVRHKIKYREVLEDWEHEYGAYRFSYKDLFIATKGFRKEELLGSGGFGMVYKGVLPASKRIIAVKRLCHESTQGMREFVAEIASLGRLRHRNLVQLLGYCRRKRELLLVYDFMPNGSLDKILFRDQPKVLLNWAQRLWIIKGVASALVYLHEEWEKVVLHRDIKASNVLLDADLNGRLGDFGLARLYDHGTNPLSTHVVGTPGYIAPELTRTGRATTSTDVFAFGIFMLEVACGQRPIDPQIASSQELALVDRVLHCWKQEKIWEAADPKLGSDFVMEEMEMVLKLGLLCSHFLPSARPSLRQVIQLLDGDLDLPEILQDHLASSFLGFGNSQGLSDVSQSSNPLYSENTFGGSSSLVADSILSGGR